VFRKSSANIQKHEFKHIFHLYACINLIRIVILVILNPTKYSFLVVLLILLELGCAAFIFFDKNWKEVSCDWYFMIGNTRSYIFHLIIIFFSGNSKGQNWRFWYAI